MSDGMIRWIGACDSGCCVVRTQYAGMVKAGDGTRFVYTCHECDRDIRLEPGVMIGGEWVKVGDAAHTKEVQA